MAALAFGFGLGTAASLFTSQFIELGIQATGGKFLG
jgi:hypothetical protein